MFITSLLLWAACSLAFAGLGLVGVYLIREGWQFGVVDGIAGATIGTGAILISTAYFVAALLLIIK